MKLKNYFALFSVFISCSALAQDNPDASSAYGNQNILKINLTSIGFGNIYLQDEYTLNGSTSIALGLSYMPSRSLPSVVVDNDPNGNAKAITFSGFSLTPEFRWYVKKHAPKGFYLAPYLRYTKYTTNAYSFSYDRANTGGAIKDVAALEGSLKSFGIGLMIGDQFKLGDHVVLDWWIIGAGFSSGKIEMSGKGNFSPGQQDDLKAEIADMDVPVGDLEYEVTSNSVDITYKTGLPGIRGFGLAFGYIF